MSGSSYRAGADGPGSLTADYDVLHEVATSLEADADGFEQRARETALAQEDLLAGCGQFAGQVSSAAAGFGASWRATLGVCAESERLSAHNLGRFVVDLSATDAQMVIL